MISKLKRFLYFPVAAYFKFWAAIQLKIWRPRIFVITGSSGKTTLLHLVESQLQDRAKYSHHANSSFGIPFDILGLKRQTLTIAEWPMLFLLAPLKAFKYSPREKMYVIEADCDRPGEGKFLGLFLKPEITMWLDISKTHTVNFDEKARKEGKPVEEVIALEFGYFSKFSRKLVMVNGDDEFIEKQLGRIKPQVKKIKHKDLQDYELMEDGSEFKIDGQKYSFKVLLPEETFYAVSMCVGLIKYLGFEIDHSFSKFQLPPGRSSLFKGLKNTTILDSSYNSNLSSMQAVLEMFNEYPKGKKWAVLSDMTELGEEEKSEHENLAEVIAGSKFDRLILMGPRMIKYVYPKLQSEQNYEVITFENPKEVLDYLLKNLAGGETILFKGARFLEGVIEHLLENKEDIKKLCRREKIWEIRRKAWGL